MIVEVWHFTGASLTQALTIDENGANLPAHLGPWKPIRATMLAGDGFDVAEARRLIDEHGYVCFD